MAHAVRAEELGRGALHDADLKLRRGRTAGSRNRAPEISREARAADRVRGRAAEDAPRVVAIGFASRVEHRAPMDGTIERRDRRHSDGDGSRIQKDFQNWPADVIEPWLIEFANDPGIRPRGRCHRARR
jgi:hypothetical protein